MAKKANNIKSKSAWIMTEGMKGTENPCIGLADQIGVSYTIKRVHIKQPWKTITPIAHTFQPSHLTKESDTLKAPFPDLVIASGRKAVAPALWIKKQSPHTKIVFIQNPRIKHDMFDLILAPCHDNLSGPNVISTKINIHHITPEKLADAKKQFEKTLKPLSDPRVAVLIGGTSKHHQMTSEIAKRLAEQLLDVSKRGHSLMITASRRTGEENEKILKETLSNQNDVFYWDGAGDNPYFGFLAWADFILVTEDSVSMVSEAVATGKPVYTIPLKGGGKRKDQFHQVLRNAGHTRPFEGLLEYTTTLPPKEMDIAVKKIQDMLLANGA